MRNHYVQKLQNKYFVIEKLTKQQIYDANTYMEAADMASKFDREYGFSGFTPQFFLKVA